MWQGTCTVNKKAKFLKFLKFLTLRKLVQEPDNIYHIEKCKWKKKNPVEIEVRLKFEDTNNKKGEVEVEVRYRSEDTKNVKKQNPVSLLIHYFHNIFSLLFRSKWRSETIPKAYFFKCFLS